MKSENEHEGSEKKTKERDGERKRNGMWRRRM